MGMLALLFHQNLAKQGSSAGNEREQFAERSKLEEQSGTCCVI